MSALDTKLEEIRRKHQLPGLAVAFSQNGEETVSFSGVRKLDDPAATPIESTDKFHFASCGKAVTAALIHQLVGEGYFTLKSKLRDLLPKDIAMTPAQENITIGQLLTHTSGLLANDDAAVDASEKMDAVSSMK